MHSGTSQSNQSVCSSVAYQNPTGQRGLSNCSLEETYQHLYTVLNKLGNHMLDINTQNNSVPATSSEIDKTVDYDVHYLLEKRNRLISNLSTNVEQLKFLGRLFYSLL